MPGFLAAMAFGPTAGAARNASAVESAVLSGPTRHARGQCAEDSARYTAGHCSPITSHLIDFPRPPQRAAGFRAGVLAIFENLYAVHEYVFHANRVLVRFFECRAVCDRCRIKDHHVSKHSLLEKSAMIQTEIGGGQSAQAMDCVAHGKNFFVAHIFAEHAREIYVGAWMRVRFQENAFRR